jgi:hypothetical protein
MIEEIRLFGPHKMETMLKEEENKPIYKSQCITIIPY